MHTIKKGFNGQIHWKTLWTLFLGLGFDDTYGQIQVLEKF